MIEPAAEGNGFIVTGKEAAVPLPQVFVGVTVIFPAVEPNVTVMLMVPAPAVMVEPAGTVQV